jgi:hypothetical protein
MKQMNTFQKLKPIQQTSMCAFVERQFATRHELFHTMAYIVGSSVQIIDLTRTTAGYRVAFFVEIQLQETHTADFDLQWPGIDTDNMEQAFAEAVLDEARRSYWSDSKERRSEVFEWFEYFNPKDVKFLKWICKSGGSYADYLDRLKNVPWTL